MKRFGCLAMLVLLMIGGALFYRSTWTQSVGGTPFSQLAPQEKQQRRAKAQDLVKQVEAVARQAKQSKPSAPKKTFVIRATEEQLNTLLQDRLRTEKFPVSDLRVGLAEGVVTLQGQAKYSGVELPATISGTLAAKAGALEFKIDSLSVSGLPAPGNLRDKAQTAIESGLQKAFAGRDRARVDAVEVAPGQLTVRGQTG